MSRQCEHNDHGHTLLWMVMFFVGMGFFDECNFGYQKLERQNADLRDRVEKLEQRR